VNTPLLNELSVLSGADVAPSQWTGEPAIWVDGREIVHAHERWVEIRLTSKLINRVDDHRVQRRGRTSDWVVALANQAAAANAATAR
jgi:hypothetical protein